MKGKTFNIKYSSLINLFLIRLCNNFCLIFLYRINFNFRKTILLGLALLLFNDVFTQELPSYSIVELDHDDYEQILAIDINNKGQVVGRVLKVGASTYSAFKWEDGAFDLYDPDGWHCFANDINDSGWVIIRQDQYQPSLKSLGFLWKDSIITDLGHLGTPEHTDPVQINNQGQVIGSSLDENSNPKAFLYSNGSMSQVFGPENQQQNTYPYLREINDSGTIVGTVWLDDELPHAVIWQGGNISTLLPSISEARNINNNGYVAIQASDDGINYYTYLYKDGFIDTMFVTYSARRINDHNQAVSTSGLLIYYNGQTFNLIENTSLEEEGWTAISLLAINNPGQILGRGIKDGKQKSFILNPQKLQLTSPEAGEILFSGDLDTIRWVASDDIERVNIYYSTDLNDGFGNFTDIVYNYPADSGYYVWKVVDTLSSTVYLSIENFDDFSTEVTSKAFMIKDYSLTRFNEHNQLERFDVTKHGWSFCNCENNLYPETWYEQFDYLFGEDPYTEDEYPEWFTEQTVNAAPFWFPDWPSFVRAFGEDVAYHINIPGILSIYKEAAAEKWGAIHDQDRWGGSCSGMVTSALLAFAFKDDFNESYPGIEATDEIYSLTGSDLNSENEKDIAIRKLSNQLYIHWFGKETRDHVNLYAVQTPRDVLYSIKNMFRNLSNEWLKYLYISNPNGPGAHAVAVYRLKRDPVNQGVWRLYIYDPNRPGDASRFITLDSLANTWSYPFNSSVTWGGNQGMFLMDGIKNYLTLAENSFETTLLNLKNTTDTIIPFPTDQPKVEIYTTKYADTKIISSNGDEAGSYHGTVRNSIANAHFIRPPTGKETPPSGLIAPVAPYFVKIKDPPDATIFATFFSDSSVYSYQRINVLPAQTDEIKYDQNGLRVKHSEDSSLFTQKSAAQVIQTVFVKGISFIPDQETVFQLNNVHYANNDSLKFSLNQQESAVLSLGQDGGSYDLLIRRHTADSSKRFIHTGIEMAPGSVHKIVPDWGETLNTVLIEIDNDADGITDIIFYADNQYLTTGISRDVYEINNGFVLFQNYPNPIQSSTNIDFMLSEEKYIQLDVYDISGKLAKSLAKGLFGNGIHTVKFNTDNLQEGVYFYRLHSDTFDEWKKCMIIR